MGRGPHGQSRNAAAIAGRRACANADLPTCPPRRSRGFHLTQSWHGRSIPGMFRAILMLLAAAVMLGSGSPVAAGPHRYRIDAENSRTWFFYSFSGQRVQGTFPVTRADLLIDFADLARSQIRVDVDVAETDAGFGFATQALRGPAMLDAARFPVISFRATRVLPDPAGGGDTARVEGRLTIRGHTQPVVLHATLWRARGTAPGDITRLTVLLEGALDRFAFGVDGFADMVGPEVRLKILARIELVE